MAIFSTTSSNEPPALVDVISFSLDGASAATNDPIRGQGSFEACTDGIRRAKAKGFQTSLIFTVSRLNLEELAAMPALLADLGIDRFFIQVIGLRGQSAVGSSADAPPLQVSRAEWENHVFAVAAKVSRQGIRVIYPKVYLAPDEPFDCAGRVADNYFVFPNGRVYRCPLCEDYPLHSLSFENSRLVTTNPLNENDLFNLNIAEGCVMNKLIQPQNLTYLSDGRPAYKIACCLLKEERDPTT